MEWFIPGSVAAVAVVSLATSLGRGRRGRHRVEGDPRDYFQTGDVPTQDQFATLIDSAVNMIYDRKLIGLKSTIRNGPISPATRRSSIVSPSAPRWASGRRKPPPRRPRWDVRQLAPLDPNDPSEMDVATISRPVRLSGNSVGGQLRTRSTTANCRMEWDSTGSAAHWDHVDYLVLREHS